MFHKSARSDTSATAGQVVAGQRFRVEYTWLLGRTTLTFDKASDARALADRLGQHLTPVITMVPA